MARLTKRLEAIERQMGEKEARNGSLSVPAELCVVALVSPETRKPVQYFDLRTGQFFPVDATTN
jgi:hypothetical protein